MQINPKHLNRAQENLNEEIETRSRRDTLFGIIHATKQKSTPTKIHTLDEESQTFITKVSQLIIAKRNGKDNFDGKFPENSRL